MKRNIFIVLGVLTATIAVILTMMIGAMLKNSIESFTDSERILSILMMIGAVTAFGLAIDGTVDIDCDLDK